MCKTLVWGLRTILCVGLILVGIGPLGLAQSTDDSAGKENQLANNKIVQILLSKYGDKYELTAEGIEDYRLTHNLGYGEILILYALADRILEPTGGEGDEGGVEGEEEGEQEQQERPGIDNVVDDILTKRTETGLGWGQIAQEYGLKLGPVVSSVRKKGKEENDGTGQNSGGYKPGKKNKGTQQGDGDYNQGKQNDDTQQDGGDHKPGKKNKGKNNKGHPGKGKGGGKGKGKK